MERTEVKSSQISEIGYDPEKQICEIQFTGKGTVYQYFDVPPEVHKALAEAESVGRYFNQNFRGKFKFKKIEEPANAKTEA